MDLSTNRPTHRSFRLACISAAMTLTLVACNSNPAPVANDATLTSSIQAQLAADTAIAGQPIEAHVQNAAATLTGTVSNDAQRTIAARDAAGIAGIRQVINNLSIATAPPASAVVLPPPAEPVPVLTKKIPAVVAPVSTKPAKKSPIVTQAPIYRSDSSSQNISTPPPSQAPTRAATPAPSKPTFRTVTVPAGNIVSVRVTQTLDSASTQPGASFSGALATDLLSDGVVAIPAGAAVSGRVDAVQEAAHFKGASLLTISLTGITRRGERIPVTSEPYTVEGKGRGKNTAIKAGGGAAVGAVLGGIFGGGRGAAIGAATGGGLGAGANAITRGQQVQIPSESVVRFRLTAPITVQVRTDAGGARQNNPSANSSDTSTDNPANNPDDSGPPVLQNRNKPSAAPQL